MRDMMVVMLVLMMTAYCLFWTMLNYLVIYTPFSLGSCLTAASLEVRSTAPLQNRICNMKFTSSTVEEISQ